MASAKKYYAVKVGQFPGIYHTWDECKDFVIGYPNAQFKSFKELKDAEKYMRGESETTSDVSSKPKTTKKVTTNEDLNLPPIFSFVDGSFNEKTGVYGYGGYISVNGVKHILQGCGDDEELASMRNVAGELEGSIAAMMFAKKNGLKNICILYDYNGIEHWADGSWKRNKKGTIAYYELVQQLKKEINIEFRKVKGHSKVEGNEEADQLAKQAVGIV